MQVTSSMDIEETKPSNVMQGNYDTSQVNTPASFTHEELLEKQNQILHLIFNIKSPGPEITRTNLGSKSELPNLVDLATEETVYLNENFNFSIPLPVKTQGCHKRDDKLLNNVHILQCIHDHIGPIWTMKFSYDGSFLCTAGRDAKLIIWQIGYIHNNSTAIKRHTSIDRNIYQKDSSNNSSPANSKHDSIMEHLPDALYLPVIPEQRTELTEQLSGGDGEYSPINPMHSFHKIINPSLETPTSSLSVKSMELFPDSNKSFHSLNNTTHSINANLNDLHEFIQSEPYRVLKGHDGDVVDISWSKTMFILSASIDKTVRLWHISKDQCLRKFLHPTILTSVEFHPDQDRYFITGKWPCSTIVAQLQRLTIFSSVITSNSNIFVTQGCFDKRIRVWDIIPEGSVREWKQTPDIATAMQFSPDGKHIAAGLINGQVFFYDFENLKYVTQLNCRNRSGQYAAGSKVTSLQYLANYLNPGSINLGPSSSHMGVNSSGICQAEAFPRRKISISLSANKLLVSTNDSSVRLYSTMDYSLEQKYKGLKSSSSKQIKSSFCENRKYLISGSDDGKVYVWKTILEQKRSFFHSLFSSSLSSASTTTRVKNYDYECFDCVSAANSYLSVNSTVTDAATGSRQTIQVEPPNNTATTACIIGIFCPSRSVEHMIINHPKLMSMPYYDDIVAQLDCTDLCSRLIVTADGQGRISVFLRGL